MDSREHIRKILFDLVNGISNIQGAPEGIPDSDMVSLVWNAIASIDLSTEDSCARSIFTLSQTFSVYVPHPAVPSLTLYTGSDPQDLLFDVENRPSDNLDVIADAWLAHYSDAQRLRATAAALKEEHQYWPGEWYSGHSEGRAAYQAAFQRAEASSKALLNLQLDLRDWIDGEAQRVRALMEEAGLYQGLWYGLEEYLDRAERWNLMRYETFPIAILKVRELLG